MSKLDLHFDYETFSPVDLTKCGHYRYAEEAEIILLAYALNDGPVQQVDILNGEPIPFEFEDMLADPSVTLWAQNASFERVITRACLGIDVPYSRWKCTSVWAASLGLPASLGPHSDVLGLGDKAKLKTGKALIKKFCVPRKPTKKILRTRNMPSDFPEDWENFKLYNRQDVESEREVHRRFEPYPMLDREWQLYWLDQKINDRGIMIDLPLVANAIQIARDIKLRLMTRAQEITGLDNPNSRKQLLEWLDSEDVITSSLTKEAVEQILGSGITNEKVIELLELRQQMAKASVSKYEAIARSVCRDGRLRGTLKFNGAGRTGRWAGQILQPQNLPSKGLIHDIPLAREMLKYQPGMIEILYDNVPQALSSTIRPALIPSEGKAYAIVDFSAIEARVLAWLAHEQWRLDLFEQGGKLYETSAERMFNLPPGSVTKKDPNRQKGKVAELALGYQGWEGALITMGALDMGLKLEELAPLASAWREANPAIEAYWYACEKAVLKAVREKTRVPVLSDYQKVPLVSYESDGKFLTCILPSGRKLYYAKPRIGTNDRGKAAVSFEGQDGTSKKWVRQWLYGGLMTENQCQAIARDCMADALFSEESLNDNTVFHVHDELIAEVPETSSATALEEIERAMGLPLSWAPGLLLKGDGFVSEFYIKED